MDQLKFSNMFRFWKTWTVNAVNYILWLLY